MSAEAFELPTPGFKFSSGGTPLTKLTGLLEKWEMVTTQFGPRVNFHFSGVTDIEATAPFSGDEAVIPVKYTDKSDNSQWGKLGYSCLAALGYDSFESFAEAGGIDLLVSKVQTWHLELDVLYGLNQDGQEMRGNVWMVDSVEGESGTAGPSEAVMAAIDLLDGKSEAAVFIKQALVHSKIKADASLAKTITSKKFGMWTVAQGYMIQDEDGAFHKIIE